MALKAKIKYFETQKYEIISLLAMQTTPLKFEP